MLLKRKAAELSAESTRPDSANGIVLKPLKRIRDENGLHYRHVDVTIDRSSRTATITVQSPQGEQPRDLEGIHAAGADWWPLAMARELDDAILMLRANELDVGTWILKTRGDIKAVLQMDSTLVRRRDNWLVKETIGLLRRTFARLEVSSRSLFALIDEGSCFGGTLFEMALAADRSYMLAKPDGEEDTPVIGLSMLNFGAYPAANRLTRLQTRFCEEGGPVETIFNRSNDLYSAQGAADLGLVTFTPDELDWDDEIRIAIEERASLSPDALTGMEANLRFAGSESMETRIFGRLSAWQNWIFSRPNAVGEHGALKVFGAGSKPKFGWKRV